VKPNALLIYLRVLRVNQWIKNFVIFTAIIFSGQLFNIDLFSSSFGAFLIFCLLSSTSYVLNDVIDYPYDRKHAIKKKRPIASGLVSIPQATFIVFVLTIVSLLLSNFFNFIFSTCTIFYSSTFFLLTLFKKISGN